MSSNAQTAADQRADIGQVAAAEALLVVLLGENAIAVSHDLRNLSLTALSEDDDPATTNGFDRWLFRDTKSRASC